MGKMLLKKLKGRKREQKLQHLHMADLAMFLTGDHCNTTETLPFNNKYDTWRGRVWKNAVHIMGLICMTTHALEKVTFISFKIDDVLWRQPINGLWTVGTGCFRESTNSTEPPAGTWCPISQTVASQYLLNMPIRINVVMTEPSISPRKRPAYQERETTSVWPQPQQTGRHICLCDCAHIVLLLGNQDKTMIINYIAVQIL